MAKKIDVMKTEILGDVMSLSELENYMNRYGFSLMETDEFENSNIIKFTNFKSQIWIDVETDECNNILVLSLKSIAKTISEPTRVEPFRTYEDLEKILDYFKNNHIYHHWFTSCLMVALGRRIGDTLSLRWSDLFLSNGEYRKRLTTLKEEKTGKIVGVQLNALAKNYIEEYCNVMMINPTEHLGERIFTGTDGAFRKALKQAVSDTGLNYPISTHSFRKFYANTIYKIHPQDHDNLMIIQTMMGHSDPEITKIYINEIERKSDKYNQDYSDYMLKKKNGEEIEISNSPYLSIAWDNYRDLLSKLWDMAKSGMDKFDGINKIIGMAEKFMV